MWVRLVTSSLLISHDRSLPAESRGIELSADLPPTEDSTKWKLCSSGCIERTSARTIRHLSHSSSPEWPQQAKSMSLCSPQIEGEPSLIFLPAGSHYFPISPHTPLPLLPPLACSAHPRRGIHHPCLPWTHHFSAPTFSLCSHTCPCVRAISGASARARNSLKLGHRVGALWPHNDKMVYNILVHYKPFYSGQYRDKVLTKAV